LAGTRRWSFRMPLDAARLLRETPLAHVELHEDLGSTNDRARQLAGENQITLPALVAADRQSAGRGRGANRWWTGAGSLACSLVVDAAALGIPRHVAPQLSLAAAVAVVDTVRPRVTGHVVGLHWPNDVFAAGRKLAGILVEAPADGRHVIGLGLNTNNSSADAPAELRPRVATLRDLAGQPVDHTLVVCDWLNGLWPLLAALAADATALAARYDELCLQRGAMLRLRAGETLHAGRCAGIAPDGALLLDTPAGRRPFYGGALEHA
jgi:BirA family biotin operon repressor/biotin-[acetyl-CoA-carboxylase] ligase